MLSFNHMTAIWPFSSRLLSRPVEHEEKGWKVRVKHRYAKGRSDHNDGKEKAALCPTRSYLVHCPLKAQCTTSKQGRSLCRSVDEQYLDRVRGYHGTEAYKNAYRKRQV